MRAGIIGAGLVGRLLALKLLQKNWHVTLFDQDDENGHSSCGWTAAGMISPSAESTTTEILINKLGIESLHLWPIWLASLHQPVAAQFSGSLLLAHPQDTIEFWRFKHSFQHQHMLTELDYSSLIKLEPELADRFQRGIFLANEGHVSTVELWSSLLTTLKALGATWHPNTYVVAMSQFTLSTNDQQRYSFDQVFDCRGLAAQESLSDLRGVRGELLWLHAPDVCIQHPVRLMHPRYALYIVPRPHQIYVIGATSIESEDMSAISVQSMLELLSAAYSVHKGFAEARIINSLVNCRPAFPNNLPRIINSNGLLRINGLYRHGYLVAPALITELIRFLEDGIKAMHYKELYYEE